MESFDSLHSLINSVITKNGNNGITGENLNSVLTKIVDTINNLKIGKEVFYEKKYALADGLASNNYYYALPDEADGYEDDVLLTEKTLVRAYIPEFTIADILQVVATGTPLDVDYGSLMTAVHRHLPIFVKEFPNYPGINSCSYLYEGPLYLRIMTINSIITIDINSDGIIGKDNISVTDIDGNGIVSISKIGVVSQRQKWTQAADKGFDYEIDSNSIVRGEIPQANIDLLRANGIIFNEDSGYFECGGLIDLSYNDAMNILAKTSAFAQGNVPVGGVGFGFVNVDEEKYRTNIPVLPYRFNMFSQSNFAYFCWKNQFIEIFNVENRAQVNPSQFNNIFAYCYRLKKILGVISLGNASGDYTSAFLNCYSLESVKLKGIKKSLDFSYSARLDNESILYMIENSNVVDPIAITLHPQAYERAMADPAIIAATEAYPDIELGTTE